MQIFIKVFCFFTLHSLRRYAPVRRNDFFYSSCKTVRFLKALPFLTTLRKVFFPLLVSLGFRVWGLGFRVWGLGFRV